MRKQQFRWFILLAILFFPPFLSSAAWAKPKKKKPPPVISSYAISSQKPLLFQLKLPIEPDKMATDSSYEINTTFEQSPEGIWEVCFYIGEFYQIPDSDDALLVSFPTQKLGGTYVKLTSNISIPITLKELTRLQQAHGKITIFVKTDPSLEKKNLIFREITFQRVSD